MCGQRRFVSWKYRASCGNRRSKHRCICFGSCCPQYRSIRLADNGRSSRCLLPRKPPIVCPCLCHCSFLALICAPFDLLGSLLPNFISSRDAPTSGSFLLLPFLLVSRRSHNRIVATTIVLSIGKSEFVVRIAFFGFGGFADILLRRYYVKVAQKRLKIVRDSRRLASDLK